MIRLDDENLHAQLDAATPDELNALDFGIVRLTEAFAVEFYNHWEAKLSGLNVDRVLGKQFFIEVAPCTNNFLVAQRFIDQQDLDAMVDYVFTFKMRPTAVRLRLLQSSSRSSRYVVVALR